MDVLGQGSGGNLGRSITTIPGERYRKVAHRVDRWVVLKRFIRLSSQRLYLASLDSHPRDHGSSGSLMRFNLNSMDTS